MPINIWHLDFIQWAEMRMSWLFPYTWSFFSNQLTQEGFCLPALFSLWILLEYTKKTSWKNWKMLLLVESVCILAAWQSLYWGDGGLHTFDLGFILFPVIAWLRPAIPLPVFYALTFLIELSGDVWGDLWRFHFTPNWYFGIGGAGFHDGVFLVPLETLIVCAMMRYGLAILSKPMGHPLLAEFRDAE